MGTHSSSNGEKDKNPNETNYLLDTCSSYKGVKTETSERSKEGNSASTTSEKVTQQDTAHAAEKNKIPVKFEWREGGELVYLTGSFLSWTTFMNMNKNPQTNVFELTLNLPKGVYQYKFVVDKIWRYSSYFPTVKDNLGNINNVIDLTKYTPPDPKPQTQEDRVKDSKKFLQSSQKPTEGKKEYNSYFPQRSEMNTDAPSIPFHYHLRYNINYNTRQNKLGKQKYLIYNEKNLLSENNSYKKVLPCPHVNL